jgi:hypothetical protein
MSKPDFEKAVNEMQRAPAVSIVGILPLRLFAMITVMQAAIQIEPEIANDNWAKIGIEAARELQEELFKQYPETYKVLEFGWNPEFAIPEIIAAMLLDMDSRQLSEQNKPNKGCETGSSETISQRLSREILDSQGFNALDM